MQKARPSLARKIKFFWRCVQILADVPKNRLRCSRPGGGFVRGVANSMEASIGRPSRSLHSTRPQAELPVRRSRAALRETCVDRSMREAHVRPPTKDPATDIR